MSSGKEIQANINFKAYSKADQIIRYLLNPDDETVTLTATEKKTYDRCKAIHGYRLRFHQTEQIIATIMQTEEIGDRQARNLINLTEKIFGTVGKPHKDYERQFLLNLSRKNIEIAMTSRDSTKITKALIAHYKMAGLDDFDPDMPDFSKLEQHKYNINLADNVKEAFALLMKSGVIKLTDIIQPPNIDFDEATEVK